MNRVYIFSVTFFQKISPFIFYILALVVVFGSAISPQNGMMIYGFDTRDSYYYSKHFYKNSLAKGELPFWSPNIFAGYPVGANPDQINMFYPVNLLFYFLPIPIAFSWYYFFHLFFAMFGMYLLCRKWLPPFPSWVAGLIFGLSGFFPARIYAGHLDLFASASYLPIVFLFFWNAMEKKISFQKYIYVTLSGLLFALQLLAGYPTMALFTLESIGFAMIVLSLRQKSFLPIFTVFISVCIGLGLSAMQTLPTFEFMGLIVRAPGSLPYSWSAGGALNFSYLPQLLFGLYKDYRLFNLEQPLYPEHILYFGGIPFIILLWHIIIYCVSRVLKARVSFSFIQSKSFSILTTILFIAIFSFWISFGDTFPIDLYHIFWSNVPLYSMLRIPPRHLLLFIFSMSVFSGFVFSRIKNMYLQLLLIAFTCVELIVFARHYIVLQPTPDSQHDQKVFSLFESNKGLWRYFPNYIFTMRLGNAVDFDDPLQFGTYSLSGYQSILLKNFFDFIASSSIYYDKFQTVGIGQTSIIMNHIPANLDFLNIKYLIEPYNLATIQPSIRDNYHVIIDNPNTQHKVLENPTYLPRYFFIKQAAYYQTYADVEQALHAQAHDLRTTMLFYSSTLTPGIKNYSCELGTPQAINVLTYTSQLISLSSFSPCEAILASSEIIYPGWHAYIDGKETPILTGNLAFRAITVPPGNHIIEYRFVPTIYFIGFILSITTTLLIIVVYVFLWRKIKRSDQIQKNIMNDKSHHLTS